MKSILVTAILVAACAVVAGCGRKLMNAVLPNQPPAIELTGSRIPSTSEDIRYRAQWTGTDADGRVDHYLVAIDPLSVDRVDEHWTSTRDRDHVISFPSSAARGAAAEDASSVTRIPHVIAVRSVDDRGAMSETRSLGFFAGNLPPTVNITSPVPSPILNPILPPSFHIYWQGNDPDGVFTLHPVKYKWTVLSQASEFPIDVAIADPDSLRRYYAPGFAGWDSLSGDTTTVQLSNLVVGQTYLFVVVAFDEAGDYSPVFSLDSNMLRFRVGIAKFLGPRITIFNESVVYTYPGGGYLDDPMAYVNVEVPQGQRVTFNWFGVSPTGLTPVLYRWALDPNDIYDETQRSGPSDLGHWSPLDNTATVTFGPFGSGLKGVYHRLYIEARDAAGVASLGIVNMFIPRITFSRELLIVDDTRRVPDQYLVTNPNCPRLPVGLWPNASELDTFLFARGGAPLVCDPLARTSTPGVFAGYDFDTIGTRGMLTIPSLGLLGKYRHVIWYTDQASAVFNENLSSNQPSTMLRYMSSSGRMNVLSAYANSGGQTWSAGGGVALASELPVNDPTNDAGGTIFSSTGRNNELGPGRFMYEVPHWRSEIGVTRAVATIARYTGRFEGTPVYAALPAAMQPKTAATDPLPPTRTRPSDFYQNIFDVEYLRRPNEILEEGSPGVRPTDLESTLDTLYQATGSGLPTGPDVHNVIMTYYHGRDCGSAVFSGFSLWSFQHDQCAQLVDFVLQQLWHLSREPDLKIVRRAAAPRPLP